MTAGRLKERIVIEHKAVLRDIRTGEELPAKIERIAARTEVRYGGGGRSNENGEIVYPYDITFTLWLHMERHAGDYDTIVYRGDRYIIYSRERDEREKALYLKCRKDG